MGKTINIDEVQQVSPQDSKFVKDTLKSKSSELVFLGWVNRPKGKSFDARLCLMTDTRIIFYNHKYKVDKESSLVEIKSVESTSPENCTLNFQTWNITIHTPQTDELLNGIVNCHLKIFPMGRTDFTVNVEPAGRVFESSANEAGICGGFAETYRAFCDYFQTPVREDIVWDVNHLFTTNNITKFNLEDFEQPMTPENLAPLLSALGYNTYFTGLIVKNIPLDRKTLTEIGKCLSRNSAITKLVLNNVGMTKDSFAVIADGIKSNPKASINIIDLSNNNLDDRAAAALGSCIGEQKNGLVQLTLSGCGMSKNGITSLSSAFRKNVNTMSTLSHLDLSGNNVDSEGSSSLSSWLASPNKLHCLNISNSNANLDTIMSALVRGCSEIKQINVSGCKLTKKASQSLAQFLKSTDSLNNLSLENSSLGPDDMVSIMQSIGYNAYIKSMDLSIARNKLGKPGALQMIVFSEANNITSLNVSDNDFTDEGVGVVCKSLCSSMSLKKLDLSRNFSPKATKSRDTSIEELINLINSDCPLEELCLQGSRSSPLKNDILSLIDGLGTNDSLLKLDISCQQSGNKGAMAIGKMLQTNRTLNHLIWEENHTTLFGFNAVVSGLRRNKSLKQMPLPVLDISNCFRTDDPQRLRASMSDLQSLLARNQNPKTLTGGDGSAGFNQFSILSSGAREHVERLKLKIKSSNRITTEEHKTILEDADNNDGSMASIYAMADAHQSIMAEEITAKLKELAKDIMPVIDTHFGKMVGTTIETITERYKSLDKDSIRRIQTSMNFGVEPLQETVVEDILANAASAEIASKSNAVFANALDICTDYLYEKITDSLIAIVDDVKELETEAGSTARERTDSDAPETETETETSTTTTTSSPTVVTSSPTVPKRSSKSKPNIAPPTKPTDVAPSPPTTAPRRGSPGGAPRGGRGGLRGRGGKMGVPIGLEQIIGGRGGLGRGGMRGGSNRNAGGPPPPKRIEPKPVRNNPPPTPEKKKKGLFGFGGPKKAPPAKPRAKPKGAKTTGTSGMNDVPTIKKTKPKGDIKNIKALDSAQKEAPESAPLTHATRERPMAARNRRPPTRRPRNK